MPYNAENTAELLTNGYEYLHNAWNPSHSDGQVRRSSSQKILASDGEDSPPSFGSSLGGHRHDKWVLKKKGRQKDTVMFGVPSLP